ncbi:MAG: galactose-1-phosphate uridylyltransferase [Candidatus Anammoximicrobium sp.]|nr:galactose-1-phosphate uridylyltransferase [Candidatus Anammoximicrobium sp.]
MSEFRKDPVSDHWVILAPNRALRPEQFAAEAGRRALKRCPFCRGHESDTPEAVATYGDRGQAGDGGQWQVRVVPNLYPALTRHDQLPATAPSLYEVGIGYGVHEVIIEAPDHVLSFGELDDLQAELVFVAFRDRLRRLRANPQIAYGQLFKNSGPAAGASLEHTHSQLIGTPIVPTQIQAELSRAQTYFERHGRCVFCEMMDVESSSGARIVAENEAFLAFCPFASQFPYEVWVLPRKHHCSFDMAEDGETRDLARLVRDLVRGVEVVLHDPAFNFLIHTSPFRLSPVSYFHWHLEFFPRLTNTAGFEWGAGDYINTVSPEDAAGKLRASCNVT